MPHYAEVVVKSIIGFIVLAAVCRGIGKKFDLVLPITLGVLPAVVSLSPSIRVTDGILAIATWAAAYLVLRLWVANYSPADTAINGKPTMIIDRGQILEKNVRKSRLTITDMMALLRGKGAFKLADVEMALMEPDGNLSVLMKTSLQPVTPRTAGIGVQDDPGPKIVIQEGQVKVQALHEHGLSVGWLLDEVRKQGANSFDDVYLAQIDASNGVFVDLVRDPIHHQPDDPNVKSRLLLLSSLKKIQADYEHFALETQNTKAKREYEQGASAIERLIASVQAELRKP